MSHNSSTLQHDGRLNLPIEQKPPHDRWRNRAVTLIVLTAVAIFTFVVILANNLILYLAEALLIRAFVNGGNLFLRRFIEHLCVGAQSFLAALLLTVVPSF